MEMCITTLAVTLAIETEGVHARLRRRRPQGCYNIEIAIGAGYVIDNLEISWNSSAFDKISFGLSLESRF